MRATLAWTRLQVNSAALAQAIRCPALTKRLMLPDVNLLWIAEEALCAALPEGWGEYTDAEGNPFYYHATTGVSTWEHPLDEYYRSLFMKLKKILIDNRAALKINDSAVLLQCALRCQQARRIFRRLLGRKRLDDAAADIQAVYRGHLVRSASRPTAFLFGLRT